MRVPLRIFCEVRLPLSIFSKFFCIFVLLLYLSPFRNNNSNDNGNGSASMNRNNNNYQNHNDNGNCSATATMAILMVIVAYHLMAHAIIVTTTATMAVLLHPTMDMFERHLIVSLRTSLVIDCFVSYD